jgi:cbb3-type cytochrome oxidase subunit 3
MDGVVEQAQNKKAIINISNMMEWEESYTPLPYVFMALLLLWTVCVIVWTFNTWTKRRWQQVATGIFKHQNPHPPIFFLPFLLLLLHDISSS